MMASTIVITDLDGTLLDHNDYSWTKASDALQLLKDHHIPLLLCSSKTALEMLPLRRDLGIEDPYVVENGAAIYLPNDGDQQVLAFGLARTEVLAILERIRQQEGVHYQGFNDMTRDELIAATGLDIGAADNALRREYTEPLLWQDTPENLLRFRKRLQEAGLETVAGGRFLHVSAGCDKGRALNWLREHYARQAGVAIKVIALGDSDNDISMLESADLPVLVRSPTKPFPPIHHDHLYRTQAIGPAGWNEAILNLLADYRN